MSELAPQLRQTDEIRFLLGDTDPDYPLLNDNEINYALAQKGGNAKSAAAVLADALANRLLLQNQPYQLADYREANGADLAKTYRALAQQLRAEVLLAGSTAAIYAGGLSQSEKDSDAADTDLPQPFFKRGMMDFDE